MMQSHKLNLKPILFLDNEETFLYIFSTLFPCHFWQLYLKINIYFVVSALLLPLQFWEPPMAKNCRFFRFFFTKTSLTSFIPQQKTRLKRFYPHIKEGDSSIQTTFKVHLGRHWYVLWWVERHYNGQCNEHFCVVGQMIDRIWQNKISP